MNRQLQWNCEAATHRTHVAFGFFQAVNMYSICKTCNPSSICNDSAKLLQQNTLAVSIISPTIKYYIKLSIQVFTLDYEKNNFGSGQLEEEKTLAKIIIKEIALFLHRV